MPTVVSHDAKAAAAAKIGVERDIGHLLFLSRRVKADQTQLLQCKWAGISWAVWALQDRDGSI